MFAALIIMVLTFASTAYEPIAVFSSNFNGESLLWYERWFHNATWLLPESWNCSGEIIQHGEEVVTSSGFLEYQIVYYIATATDKAVGGFPYSNEALQNCSVLMLNLLTFNGQTPVTGNEDEVKPLLFDAKKR